MRLKILVSDLQISTSVDVGCRPYTQPYQVHLHILDILYVQSQSLLHFQEYGLTMTTIGRYGRPAIKKLLLFHHPQRCPIPLRLPWSRSVATHTFNHHAAAISILPTNIDTSSQDFKENTRQMGEVMARMTDLHARIEKGGSTKARDKHIARGKMLPREYAMLYRWDVNRNSNG